ncbi:hypothetical protein HPG69_002246, partial [Diceros bicornis minor]
NTPGHQALLNPTIFFHIIVNNEPLDSVSLELFEDKIPKTAENFCVLSTGEKGFELFWGLCARVVTSHAIMAPGSKSIYGEKFDDENFLLKHTGPGILSAANVGPNTNSFQFFICIAKAEWLNGKWGLGHGETVHKCCRNYGALWIQEWQDQQEDHHYPREQLE